MPGNPRFIWFERHSHNGLIISVLAVIVFSNALNNGFHQDDYYRIKDNPEIHRIFPITRHFTDYRTSSTLDRIDQFRPLLPLSLSINYAIAGDSLVGYHLVNLLIDITAALLFYFLVIELLLHWAGGRWTELQSRRIALFAATLYAIHPVTGILVNYICSRDQLMMSMFGIGALLVYVRMRTHGESVWGWCAAVLLAAASVLSKTDGAIFAVVIAAFEIVLAKSSLHSVKLYLRVAPFFAVAFGFFLYTTLVLHFSDLNSVAGGSQVSGVVYAFAQARIHLFRYARNFFWPFHMIWGDVDSLQNNSAQQSILGLLFIGTTLAFAWRLRKTQPVLSFCILAYWILIAPTSSFAPIIEIVKDYRPYPASPWFYLAAAVIGATYIPKSRRMAPAVLSVLFFSIASYAINTDWLTDETLWGKSIENNGTSLAHMNYAMGIPNGNDPRVLRELETAVRMDPGLVLAHTNLGLQLIEHGDTARGVAECLDAVRRAPSWAQVHYWLSVAYSKCGRIADASHELAIAAQLDPRNQLYATRGTQVIRDGLITKSLKYYLAGNFDSCVVACRAALAVDSNSAEAYNNLCSAYYKLQRFDEAVATGEKAVALRPDWDRAKNNLELARSAQHAGTAPQ